MTTHRKGPPRQRPHGWRAALMLAAAVLGLALLAPPALAGSAADLDPLLRALSIRPWWGDPAPVAPVGLDGNRHSLDGLKGRAALLYFWATW